jgi:hypothetical protein
MSINAERRIKKNKPAERGQAIIMIVFSLIGLVGVLALAVDGGSAFLEKRRAQNAADNVALGGALARIKGPQDQWVNATYGIAQSGGYNNDGVHNSVSVVSPPTTGEYAGNVEYIQVRITSHVPTYFGSVLGLKSITVVGEAVSRTKTQEIVQLLNGNALVSLAPTSNCEDKKSFWVHGESTLNVMGGGIFVNSDNPDCALMQSGNGSIRIDYGGEITVVGGADIKKPQLLTPFPPVTGAFAMSYPPPFIMPKLGCRQEAQISEDGMSLSAGAWSGDFPPIGVNSLEPGVYCVDGDFILNGGAALAGNNVVIKVEGGGVRFNGGAAISLKAPTQGDLAGLLLYLPMDNHNDVTLNGSADSEFRGTILAPGADIHINGNFSTFGFHSQIIGYRILSDGTSNIVINYKNEDNYDAYNMPEVQLAQ